MTLIVVPTCRTAVEQLAAQLRAAFLPNKKASETVRAVHNVNQQEGSPSRDACRTAAQQLAEQLLAVSLRDKQACMKTHFIGQMTKGGANA